MDGTESIFINKGSDSPTDIQVWESNQDRNESSCIPFGWGKFRPKCLQFLNSPRWFLVAIVAYTLCQGIAALGLTSFVLPSIERRFSLSSKELGIIASANDISALLLVVFISFYGDYGNKIKWIGGGAVLVGLGLLLFSLPHFLVGPYEPSDIRVSGLCHVHNNTIGYGSLNCKAQSGGEWYYMVIFIGAQVIIGAGLSPFYPLVSVYLDENVQPKSMPIYLGLSHFFTFIGPGLGYLIGGKFLGIYVDIEQPAGLKLTPRDPRWIGAWWPGFLIFGSAILLWALIILGFPREMPGAKDLRAKHISQGHLKRANGVEIPRFKDILPELKHLLTNWTFLFNTLALSILMLFASPIATFFAKILRLKFGLDPMTTGYVLALISILSIALGNLFGSLSVRVIPLKTTCKTAALICFVCQIFGAMTPFTFLIPGCMNTNLAGLEVPYDNGLGRNQKPETPSVSSLPLTAPCNTQCQCSMKKFSPVCGSNSVTYFDACHAGCTVIRPNKTFTNCSCIASNYRPGTAKFGYCDRQCKNIVLFVVAVSLILVIRFTTTVPGRTVVLRCVPDNKRAFAVGIQYLSMKALGLLPGPIIFGHLVDMSCRIWQDDCGKEGRCFDYDIDGLSRTICIYGATITSMSTVGYFLSWYLCKQDNETDIGTTIENRAPDLRPPNEEFESVKSVTNL